MKIEHGATRTVLLTKRYALKFPTCRYGWQHFLAGLLANMQERVFGRTGWPELCPVLLSDPFGFLVVMPKADEFKSQHKWLAMSKKEFKRFVEKDGYHVPAENKPDSFGVLKGRPVVIDYGGCCIH